MSDVSVIEVEGEVITIEIVEPEPITIELVDDDPIDVIELVEKGEKGEPGEGGTGGGVSFLPDPGPVVAPGETVLWVRPASGSYSLIVREG